MTERPPYTHARPRTRLRAGDGSSMPPAAVAAPAWAPWTVLGMTTLGLLVLFGLL